MKKKIKLVLWDFGGVLTNSPIKNFYHYEKNYNLPLGTIVKINSQNKYNNAWALLEKNLINKKEFSDLFSNEAKDLNLKHNFNIEEILECLDVKLNKSMVKLFFQVKEKVECACLTNNIDKSIHYNASETFTKFKKYFSKTFESSRLGLRKPEEEIYRHVMANVNINAENILFIDDLGINLKPAKIIGFNTYKMVGIKQIKQYFKDIL